MSCSHCLGDDHNKRKCPNLDRSREELREAWLKEHHRFYDVANFVADILGAYPPEERTRLALEAFDRSRYRYYSTTEEPLRQRERAALDAFKIEVEVVTPRSRRIGPSSTKGAN